MDSPVTPVSETDEKFRCAVHAIARKTHLAAQGPSQDFLFELARMSISFIVGPSAVHEVEAWKTEEKYNWAIDQVLKALTP